VAGEHLLDVAVEPAGGGPLRDELRLRPLADPGGHPDRHRDGHHGDDRQQWGDPEHHGQHADDGQQRGDQLGERLLQRLGDVVGVVRGPAQHLAARLLVEVGQRQPGQLALDVLAQPLHGALHDGGGEPGLQHGEERRRHVDQRRPGQHVPQPGEVDALAGNDVHGGEHVGAVGVALLPQPVDGVGLGDVRRQHPADHAGEDDVGGPAEQQRSQHGQEDAGDAEQQHHADQDALRAQHAEQAFGGALEVLQFLGRHAAGHHPGRRSAADGWTSRPPRGCRHAVPPMACPPGPCFAAVQSVMPQPPAR
jgi:hypothetical protein